MSKSKKDPGGGIEEEEQIQNEAIPWEMCANVRHWDPIRE
jgi:hypothetical protein